MFLERDGYVSHQNNLKCFMLHIQMIMKNVSFLPLKNKILFH